MTRGGQRNASVARLRDQAVASAADIPVADTPAADEAVGPQPVFVSLDVRDLAFSYGGHEVLAGVTFSARAEQTVCLLGCNGAGKSTLFRCILGLENVQRGSIELDGRPLAEFSRKQLCRSIAAIPQSSDPTFDYAVIDVVLMGRTAHLGVAALPDDEDEEVAFHFLEQLGIAHLASKGYACISGGERQLVLIARALAQQAKVLIMDEPTANLDFGNQHRVMEQIEELRRAGYLIIMSTHNPQQALGYASKVLVLHQGVLLAEGSPGQVMTEEILRQAYGIPVALYDVKAADGTVRRLCAPG